MRKFYVPSDFEVPSSRPCWTLPSARAGPWAGSPCTARPPPSTNQGSMRLEAVQPAENVKIKTNRFCFFFFTENENWFSDRHKTFSNSSNIEISLIIEFPDWKHCWNYICLFVWHHVAGVVIRNTISSRVCHMCSILSDKCCFYVSSVKENFYNSLRCIIVILVLMNEKNVETHIVSKPGGLNPLQGLDVGVASPEALKHNDGNVIWGDDMKLC